jgi:hypothetical protein
MKTITGPLPVSMSNILRPFSSPQPFISFIPLSLRSLRSFAAIRAQLEFELLRNEP